MSVDIPTPLSSEALLSLLKEEPFFHRFPSWKQALDDWMEHGTFPNARERFQTFINLPVEKAWADNQEAYALVANSLIELAQRYQGHHGLWRSYHDSVGHTLDTMKSPNDLKWVQDHYLSNEEKITFSFESLWQGNILSDASQHPSFLYPQGP